MTPKRAAIALLSLLAPSLAGADASPPTPTTAAAKEGCRKARKQAEHVTGKADQIAADQTAARRAIAALVALPPADADACLTQILTNDVFVSTVSADAKLARAFNDLSRRRSPLTDAALRAAKAFRGSGWRALAPFVAEETPIDGGRGSGHIQGIKAVRRWMSRSFWDDGYVEVSPLVRCDDSCCTLVYTSDRGDHSFYLESLCFDASTKLTGIRWIEPESGDGE